jgi:hypothetical protein
MNRISCLVLACATALIASASGGEQPAKAKGVLWQVTSQMVMAGMPMSMPASTHQVCSAEDANAAPPSGDDKCVSSNYKRTGNKATWAVSCAGDMNMKGEGQIEFQGDDSYAGEIKLAGGPAAMTIKISGKKLGACDNPK